MLWSALNIKSVLRYFGEWQLNIYPNHNFIALKKKKKHSQTIQGHQPNANEIICLCRWHTAAWIASNHFTRKLICIYTMCLIHQSYQVQCTTKTLKQQSDKHSIESTTAHTHTASFKEVIEEISPWCKYCKMKISTLLDECVQMCPNARGCVPLQTRTRSLP